jgi:hypothetical protein
MQMADYLNINYNKTDSAPLIRQLHAARAPHWTTLVVAVSTNIEDLFPLIPDVAQPITSRRIGCDGGVSLGRATRGRWNVVCWKERRTTLVPCLFFVRYVVSIKRTIEARYLRKHPVSCSNQSDCERYAHFPPVAIVSLQVIRNVKPHATPK